MTIFELQGARLVPASLGAAAGSRERRTALEAAGLQLVEVLRRPLLTVCRDRIDGGDTLVALDATGQVVTVEILDSLNAERLLAAMSRAGRNVAGGWGELTHRYPGGGRALRADLEAMRGSTPTQVASPRLILLAAHVPDEIRASLLVLTGSAVDVHELTVRTGDGRRVFVSVEPLAPHPASEVDRSSAVTAGRRTRSTQTPRVTPSAPSPALAPISSASSSSSSTSSSRPSSSPAPFPSSSPSRFSAPRVPTSRAAASPAPAAEVTTSRSSSTRIPYEPADRARLESALGITRASETHIRRESVPPAPRESAPRARQEQAPRPTYESSPRSTYASTTRARYEAPRPQSSDRPAAPTGLDAITVNTLADLPRSGPLPPHAHSPMAAALGHRAPEAVLGAAPTVPQGEESEAALAFLAAKIRTPVTLVWHRRRRGIHHEAVLRGDGTIMLANGTVHRDPSLAANAAQHTQDVDGWRVWRMGEEGPSLAEVLGTL